jgi:surfactin synthase thioesterase subunit
MDEKQKFETIPQLLELRPPLDKNIIIFPHAGSLGKSYLSILPYLPNEYGVISVDYPELPITQENTFSDLALFYAQSLQKYFSKNVVFIGISLGGYLAYKIAQFYYCKTGIAPSKTILISVQDPQTVLSFVKSPKLNLSSLVDFPPEIDEKLKEEIVFRVKKDIFYMRSFEINKSLIIPSDLYVFNGTGDNNFSANLTVQFWGKMTTRDFFYSAFEGKHLPLLDQWAKILDACF